MLHSCRNYMLHSGIHYVLYSCICKMMYLCMYIYIYIYIYILDAALVRIKWWIHSYIECCIVDYARPWAIVVDHGRTRPWSTGQPSSAIVPEVPHSHSNCDLKGRGYLQIIHRLRMHKSVHDPVSLKQPTYLNQRGLTQKASGRAPHPLGLSWAPCRAISLGPTALGALMGQP